MTQTSKPENSLWFSFGMERLGLLALVKPLVSAGLIILVSIAAAFSLMRISIDDSVSELFRSNTEEFVRYELVAEKFPSSEFDVILVVEGENHLPIVSRP